MGNQFFTLILLVNLAAAAMAHAFETIYDKSMMQDPVEEMISKYATNSPSLIEHAKSIQQLVAAGKRDEAKKSLAEMTKQFPDCGLAYQWWAVFDIEDEDWKPAIEKLSRAIEIDEKNYRSLQLRGGVYVKTGKYTESIRDLTTVLEVFPQDWRVRTLRAMVYMRVGEAESATKDFNAAVTDSNREPLVLRERSLHFLVIKNHVGAHADLSELLERTPKDLSVNEGMGGLMLQLDRYVEAARYFTIAVEANPKNAECFFGRGYAREKLNDFPNALLDYRQAVTLVPTAHKYYQSLATLLVRCPDDTIRDLDEAKKAATKANLLSLGHSDCLYLMAEVCEEREEFAEAIEHYRKAIEIAPRNADYYESFAILLSTCKNLTFRNLDKAETMAKLSIRLTNSESWEALQSMAIVLSQGYRFTEAIDFQDQCIALAPKTEQERLATQRKFYSEGKTYQEYCNDLKN